MRRFGFFGIVLIAGAVSAAELSDDFFRERPAFSRAEIPATEPATCESIAAQLPQAADAPPADIRVDLAIKGTVSLVKSDAVLWYVAVCSDPGVRVLCVAYSDNGVKVGDTALLRGAYGRPGRRHVSLDPCLVSPVE